MSQFALGGHKGVWRLTPRVPDAILARLQRLLAEELRTAAFWIQGDILAEDIRVRKVLHLKSERDKLIVRRNLYSGREVDCCRQSNFLLPARKPLS